MNVGLCYTKVGVDGAAGIAAAITLKESETTPSPITLTALTWNVKVLPPVNDGDTFALTVKVS
jgi:hypothetical protein